MTATGFLAGLPFAPDPFQAEAAAAIDRGETVVVCAPTGSGKTVVAEAAVSRALERGERALYTTPLKALSNQKFGDFRRRLGPEAVGLLTGDNSLNGTAPVVVMTTEVLRNMMYAASPDLANVGVVVLDEVHYLQDRARGPVWEEIIIHLDAAVPLVCLSATVANAEEFAAWIEARRGPTTLIVERERPVPLESLYLLRDRWESGRLRLMPVFEDGERRRPNGRLIAMLRARDAAHRRYAAPRRTDACEFLRREGLLPAIYFIFSRAGCNAAAASIVDHGLRLTTAEEAAVIRAAAAEHTTHLDPADLDVLGYGRWLAGLEAGVAPHHAGLVPAFKEAVERLFAGGLVKLVFATETLSLGINMPARAVVLESLTKFGGEGHELLQAGDYTQLTGRAGRRGIDRRGTAVVLHSPHLPFERVAAIAATGSHPLRSSFRPTYNMAANLVAAYPRPRAEQLLNASFAQFHDERGEADLAEAIAEERRALAADRAAAECERGDVAALAAEPPRARDEAMSRFAASTAAGDVLEWPGQGETERRVVIARGHGKRPRLLVIGEDAALLRLSPEQLPPAAAVVGRLTLPEPYQPREAQYRRAVAGIMRGFEATGVPRAALAATGTAEAGAASCPDLAVHLAAARSALRRERRLETLERRRRTTGSGMVPRLRAIIGLLGRWGYAGDWSLTPAGQRLRFIYNEMDLLVAEALQQGCFDGLESAEAAALASLFTFEPRGDASLEAWPTRRVEERAGRVQDLWMRLAADEEAAGLPQTRSPEAGFASMAYRWGRGAGLDDLFREEGGGVGDFVRNCRQLIDLLRQMAEAAPHLGPGLAASAAALDRGVVAATGAV
ncbi:MAG: DEAD/DEAH box helicase [Acidimicrobiia bacterium]|nr:DEAD/DEAH box helicase [Acidimicrobiia bacterium]